MILVGSVPAATLPPNPDDPTADQRVQEAIRLIQSGSAVDAGVNQLTQAAVAGHEEAKYTLGWLLLRGAALPKDNDRALHLLESIDGDLKIAARILIGVVYAEGSNQFAPNKEQAQRAFEQAAAALNEQMREFRKSPPSSPRDIALRKQWLEDWTVLVGMAGKYELAVPRRTN